MATVTISTRLDENLLAEIDTFAAAKDITRSEAIGSLLQASLASYLSANERMPGWDAKEIARIAVEYYRGMAAMFEAHHWQERGVRMLPSVQRRVAEQYGSVQHFLEVHVAQDPAEFRKGLQKNKPSVDPIEQSSLTSGATQRDYMRELVKRHGLNKEAVCADFAEALRAGLVRWKRNSANLSPASYADLVWRNGEQTGWLPDAAVK